MRKQTKNKFYELAKNMPPLYHTLPNSDFDLRKSQVMKWILEQDEFLNFLWNTVKNTGAIKYNSDTHKWQGG